MARKRLDVESALASLAMFRAATGRAGLANPEDRAAFQAWKRSRITDLVHRIREEAVSARPGVALTVAAWNRPDTARDQYLQDSVLWLNEGSIDRVIPMIYTDKDDQYETNLKAWLAATPNLPVSPGVASYMHAIGQTPRQLQLAVSLTHANGYCLFSYASIFESIDPSQRRDDKAVQERAQRRASIVAWVHATYPETAPPPPDAPK